MGAEKDPTHRCVSTQHNVDSSRKRERWSVTHDSCWINEVLIYKHSSQSLTFAQAGPGYHKGFIAMVTMLCFFFCVGPHIHTSLNLSSSSRGQRSEYCSSTVPRLLSTLRLLQYFSLCHHVASICLLIGLLVATFCSMWLINNLTLHVMSCEDETAVCVCVCLCVSVCVCVLPPQHQEH